MSELIEKLNWRYATKRMNGQAVPQEKLDNILEAIKLAPSSVGLQPYKYRDRERPGTERQDSQRSGITPGADS